MIVGIEFRNEHRQKVAGGLGDRDYTGKKTINIGKHQRWFGVRCRHDRVKNIVGIAFMIVPIYKES